MQHVAEYVDRQEAGQSLAALVSQQDWKPSLVLALPKGGVPIAFPVSECLGVPLNLLIATKIRHPSYPEVAIGAMSESGSVMWQEGIRENAGLSEKVLEFAENKARTHLNNQVSSLRMQLPEADLRGQSVVLVDDGIATGMTMEVAIWSAKEHGAEKVYLATPVASQETYERLSGLTDGSCCPHVVHHFRAVADHYVDFRDVPLDEVLSLLRNQGPRGS